MYYFSSYAGYCSEEDLNTPMPEPGPIQESQKVEDKREDEEEEEEDETDEGIEEEEEESENKDKKEEL